MRAGRLALVVAIALVALAGVGAALVPLAGPHLVRSRVLPRVAERLGRTVTAGRIRCGYRTIRLYDVTVRGPDDPPDAPLVHVDEVDVQYDLARSLGGRPRLGEVLVDHPAVAVWRDADGHDNVSDVLDRLRARRETAGQQGGLRPTRVTVRHGQLRLRDDADSLVGQVGDVQAEVMRSPDGSTLHLGDATIGLEHGPQASAASLDVDFELAHGSLAALPTLTVTGGRLALLSSLAFTGIAGQIGPGPDGKVDISFTGGYGGAPGRLWQAQGSADLASRTGTLHVTADRFTLDRLAPVLGGTPILRPEKTSLGADLAIGFARDTLTWDGRLDVSGLNLFLTKLAPVPIPNLTFAVEVHGAADLPQRKVTLSSATFTLHGLRAVLSGTLTKGRSPMSRPVLAGTDTNAPVAAPLVPPASDDDEDAPSSAPVYLPGWLKTISFAAHLHVPSIACDTALRALPSALVPYIRGFRLSGSFRADIDVGVDFGNPSAATLGGDVGIFGCKVEKPPTRMNAKRLAVSFEQHVEAEPGKDLAFLVGPENPDFVPLADISPYMVDAVLTTEDGSFFKNKGFDDAEFQAALRTDLEKGGFRYGASSITMQMVKNVLLSRDKTLSRKLQESFLTWYLTQALPKERLLEIYLNVIEFGPDLFGVGPAARHYFGKAAKDLNPIEAAYLASILPSPRGYYAFYCRGQVSPSWDQWLRKIVFLMHDHQLITDAEYDQYKDTPLEFALPPGFDPTRTPQDPAITAQIDACLDRLAKLKEANQKETADRLEAWRKRALGEEADDPPPGSPAGVASQ